jgi:hypothetical protein
MNVVIFLWGAAAVAATFWATVQDGVADGVAFGPRMQGLLLSAAISTAGLVFLKY